MKKLISSIIIILNISTFGQTKTACDFGYRQIILKYKNDNIDILIKSKKGEENVQKPLFFFCQGSLPQPLIKYDSNSVFSVFPFDTDILLDEYHLVIVSKPYIPVVAECNSLSSNFSYIDSTGKFPKEYSARNLLSYYVPRNIAILKYLRKQNWVKSSKIVVAGHSEGSTIAAKMSLEYKKITHLIYAGGNPMGRIMSMIGENRARETDSDTTNYGEQEIKYWESVIKNISDMDDSRGDTNLATFEFSQSPIEYLVKLEIPVLVSYGTKDLSAPFNDFMRVNFIQKGKINFTFQAYVGTEHNFFPLNANNKPNYEIFNWDKVAVDWLEWLNAN